MMALVILGARIVVNLVLTLRAKTIVMNVGGAIRKVRPGNGLHVRKTATGGEGTSGCGCGSSGGSGRG